MTVTPRKRRPDQNTGRRAKTMLDVESVACPDRDGPHWLINREAVTECRGCGAEWWRLDAEINGRAS